MADFPFLFANHRSPTAELPLFKELAWNFEKNCFRYDGDGNNIILEGAEALKVWITKLFKTERQAYLAYSSDYGFSKKKFFAKVLSVQERRSQLRKEIIDALLVNPYIVSVNSITFTETSHGRELDISIELSTVYGQLSI